MNRTEGIERQTEELDDVGTLLNLFADDEVRELFRRCEVPKSVQQLAEECDIPESTAYRKVDRLVEANVLVPLQETQTAKEATEYRRAVDAVEICIREVTTVTYR
ncbi:MAG: hypothetical protein PPP58_07810 [Natronomonas sp.]